MKSSYSYVESILRENVLDNATDNNSADIIICSILSASKKLTNSYEEDVRNLFKKKRIRNSIASCVSEFYPHDFGVFSELALNMYNHGLINLKDPQNLLPVMNIDKLRLHKMTGIVDFDINTADMLNLKLFGNKTGMWAVALSISNFCKEQENRKNGQLEVQYLDDALRIITSEVCVKMDTFHCFHNCPLDELCSKNFFVYNKKNNSLEEITPKNYGQLYFSIMRL